MGTPSRKKSTLLCSILSILAFAAGIVAQEKDPTFALQRGFRTGYSDGYMAGYRDTIDSLPRAYDRHDEYNKADRTYSREYGSMGDFRDGYQQGFESGYDTGFDRRAFESTMPAGLKKRGVVPGDRKELVAATDSAASADTPATTVSTHTDTITYASTNGSVIVIPRDTELILELQDDLSTERSREGDKFTAKVVSPAELSGAMVEGRVSKVTHPGRIRRRSELNLSFDRILLSDNRWSNISGTLIEVMPVKGDNVKRVDSEGTAIGPSSLKSDAVKVGGATGAGLLTGAIVGGPVGAAVGAGVGAAFGVGAVVIERGKHVKLAENQQIRIKTAYETQIR